MYKIYRPGSIPNDRLKQITVYETSDNEAKFRCFRSLLRVQHLPRKRDTDLLNTVITIDIESSTLPAQTEYNHTEEHFAIPYLYQVYIAGYMWVFRYDNDFIQFIHDLEQYLEDNNSTVVCYIHNFSYEYQFFKSRLSFDNHKTFALQKRRIAKTESENHSIIYKCSYLLSNMSLEKFTENYNTSKFRKDKELIDYEEYRFPWSDLTNEVLYYSCMDVITLYHAVMSIMNREHDNVKTIPLTNTGYVRRSYKEACYGKRETHKVRKDNANKTEYESHQNYRKMIRNCMPTLEQYKLMEMAFRGGNTHANRSKVEHENYNVDSFDFSSSYPAVLIGSDEFPMGKLKDTTEIKTLEDMDYYASNYWVLVQVMIEDLHLREPEKTPCPYISKSKVLGAERGGEYDNGRILSQPGTVFYTFLGCEWAIIKKQYTGKFTFLRAFYSIRGYLPNPIRKTCSDWFKAKTELKGVAGFEYEYMKSKNRVNSSYGMMVEKIIKEVIEPDSWGNLMTRRPTPEEEQEQIDEYTKPKNNKFLLYQWGITITALARVRHMEVIDIFGEDFIYGDTDSCKVTNAEKYLDKIEAYNETWKKYTSSCGVPMSAVTKKGELQYLGLLDWEKDHHADIFKTLGAKKYACQDSAGNLEITIAGVPKKAGAKMLGSIDNFKPGFVFKTEDSDSLNDRQNWKKLLTYRDDLNEEMLIDGHKIVVRTCIAMTRTEYCLSITNEYEQLTGYHDYYIKAEDPEVWA